MPENWTTKIEDVLVQELDDQTSTFTPRFPWKEFAEKLQERLHIEDFKISAKDAEWKSKEHFFHGLGNSPSVLSFTLTPLEGSFFWVMPKEDINRFLAWMQDTENKSFSVENTDLAQGIYQYATLQALDCFSALNPFDDLRANLQATAPLSDTGYVVDISLHSKEETLWGRLIVSSELKKSFSKYFANKKPRLQDCKQGLDAKITLSLTNGSVVLSPDELRSLKEGDLLVVDNAHYSPLSEKGSMQAFIGDRPVFQVKPKHDEIKILEYIYDYAEEPYV